MAGKVFWVSLILAVVAAMAEARDGKVSSDRSLHVRSIPGVQGFSSDIYEIYMQPYSFDVAPLFAMVELKSDEAEGGAVSGELSFTQPHPPEGPVIVRGNITGLSPGLHGFHIHQWSVTKDGCKSTGAHFNPYLVQHGAPGSPIRHVGDLGNVKAGDDGLATVDFLDPLLSLVGHRSIVGRSVVVHASEDDLGRGRTPESFETGSSGNPVACGIIGHR